MKVVISRRNTLYYDRTLLNYWHSAKENPMASLHLCRESKGEPSECNAVAVPQTCWYRKEL